MHAVEETKIGQAGLRWVPLWPRGKRLWWRATPGVMECEAACKAATAPTACLFGAAIAWACSSRRNASTAALVWKLADPTVGGASWAGGALLLLRLLLPRQKSAQERAPVHFNHGAVTEV
jgi:hypothetical protein